MRSDIEAKDSDSTTISAPSRLSWKRSRSRDRPVSNANFMDFIADGLSATRLWLSEGWDG